MSDTRKTIAIIGSGISGLGAAYLLAPHYAITVYEKNAYAGGHSRTLEVATPDGTVAVDTGFIVFNYRNYPLLTGLFEHLNVPVAKSDMSFGASINGGWLEYGTQHLSNLFAQKRNLLRPEFWRMIVDILRFNRQARRYLASDPAVTLGECLDALGMGAWFREYFLLAMGGAIWSTPLEHMLKFPAATFVRFFENHGLLTVNDQPQWYTVTGGSREYVKRLTAPFQQNIRLGCGGAKIIREAESVTVMDTQGGSARYDAVVFACHADEALAMIDRPTDAERRILSAFTYQPNRAVLHSDTRFMPKRKGAWASWVYLCESAHDAKPCVSLTYWMNRLQPLPTRHPILVTLNPGMEPDRALVHNDHQFTHPVFNEAAIRAQAEMATIQGKDRFWFAGAYQRYGFHEDGLGSAVAVARQMGIEPPWK
jgi:predicted NAD/FAD-binding protein